MPNNLPTDAENSHRMVRMDSQLVTKDQLDEKCRGCHKIENMKHEESTNAINRLGDIMEKFENRMEIVVTGFEQKLGTYIPPAVHWVGELKTGALATGWTIAIALIIYTVTK